MDFSARYVLIKPPSAEVLKDRLSETGLDDAAIRSTVDNLPTELDESKVADLFDKVVSNDELDQATEVLAGYIFDKEGDGAKSQDDAMDQDDNEDEEEDAEDNERGDAVSDEVQAGDEEGIETDNAPQVDEEGSTIVVATSIGEADTSMEDAVADKETDEEEGGE